MSLFLFVPPGVCSVYVCVFFCLSNCAFMFVISNSHHQNLSRQKPGVHSVCLWSVKMSFHWRGEKKVLPAPKQIHNLIQSSSVNLYISENYPWSVLLWDGSDHLHKYQEQVFIPLIDGWINRLEKLMVAVAIEDGVEHLHPTASLRGIIYSWCQDT